MKPRTKLQFRVAGLSSQLPNIENMMIDWAKSDCLKHIGYATKSRVICMECGQRFSPELVKRKRAICPHCGASLKIEQSRKRTDKQTMFIAKAEICEEFQVIRSFELIAYYQAEANPRYFIREILQHWIKDDGNREVVARANNTRHCGWCGDLEIRNKIVGSYYYSCSNDVYCERYHPASVFRSKYIQMGIDGKLRGMSFLTATNTIPHSPKAETLLKARRYELIDYFEGHRYKIDMYWPSIKICLRNKYRIKDVSMWFDYLKLLEHYRKDLHNAHYVCPKDLKKAHDLYMVKKKRDDEKERKAKEMQRLLKLKKEEENYIKEKSKFFDIKLSDGKIVVIPLKSLEEFQQEGEIMHHCVFTNEYFKKKDSLILSARIGKKHIETVEVNLKTFSIVQSRGACNSNTEYHNRIIGLVKKNMNLIRQKLTA